MKTAREIAEKIYDEYRCGICPRTSLIRGKPLTPCDRPDCLVADFERRLKKELEDDAK